MTASKRQIKKKSAAGSNPGNSKHSWRPFWLWQLIRRNKAYQETCATIMEQIDNSKLWLPGRTLVEVIQDPAYSRLYELIHDVSDTEFDHKNNFENSAYKYVEYTSKGTLTNGTQDWIKFEQKFSKSDRCILRGFREVWGGLISLPMLPSCKSPPPLTLEAVIVGQPVRIAAKGARFYSVNTHPNCLVLELNLNHSIDKIEREMKSIIGKLREQSKNHSPLLASNAGDCSKPRWQDLSETLEIYDLHMECLTDAAIATKLNLTNRGNVKGRIESAKKYIDSVTPRPSKFNFEDLT